MCLYNHLMLVLISLHRNYFLHLPQLLNLILESIHFLPNFLKLLSFYWDFFQFHLQILLLHVAMILHILVQLEIWQFLLCQAKQAILLLLLLLLFLLKLNLKSLLCPLLLILLLMILFHLIH